MSAGPEPVHGEPVQGEPAPSVPSWIARLPKAELHLHLEGAATPETLVALAAARGRRLALEEARRRFTYRDFLGFLLAFLLRDLLRRLHQQNVLYAEITLAAGVVLWKRQDVDAVFAALRDAQEEAQKEHPAEVRWIFDGVRNFGADHVAHAADCALRWQSAGVVGFGIGGGGDEHHGPPERFRDTFDRVRAAGLRPTVHAGETGGPESIWGALRALGAERIGHGLAAVKDSGLMEHLKEKKIPLEVCPTSNLRTGALAQHTGEADLARHPLVDYCRRGLRVTLSTDDPGLFDTTLNQEYALAHRLGLTREEIIRLAEASFQAAFSEPALKQELLERFRAGAAAL